MTTATAKTDFNIVSESNLFLVYPQNEKARQWILENVQTESWQWFGGGLAVDQREIENLVEGMKDEGFTIS